MSQHVAFLLLGLGGGAVAAALALAVVVTYRSSQVLNLATGAIAMVAAYVYGYLRHGQVFIPIPGLPKTADLGGPVPAAAAMPVALAVTAAFSVALYLVVFRPLRNAPPAARGVASIGVMLVIQAAIGIQAGTLPLDVPKILPSGRWHVGSIAIPQDRAALAVVIVGMGIMLWVMFRFTMFGLATRAVAETEKGAAVVGVPPTTVAVINWALTGVVAGIAGILISPIVPLSPSSYTLFIIPALAAAALGRFVRLGPAVIAGLAIGMVQSELGLLRVQHSWLPATGLPELVPLVVVLVVLATRGGPLPTRGTLLERSLGRSPRPERILPTAAVGLIVGAVALVAFGPSQRAGLITSLVMGLAGLSFVVAVGYAGQVTVAQLALAGASAFALSGMTTSWHVPFPLAPLLAAAVAAVVGTVAGLPALRIRGLSFAVVTLALAVAIESLVFDNPKYSGGALGAEVAHPKLFGMDLWVGIGRTFPRISFGMVALVVLIAVAVGVAFLRRSALGIAMLTMRTNERAAAAAGVDVVATKLVAFAIASFIAGLAGAMYAYEQTVVSPGSYSVFIGLGIFAVAYLAGITSVAGGILTGMLVANGLVYVLVRNIFPSAQWYDLLGGIGLVAAVIAQPNGLAGEFRRLAARFQRPAPVAAAVTSRRGDIRQLAGRRVPAGGEPLLEVRDLTVQYGGVVAVHKASLVVRRGSIMGLIGPNGAGKTTFIDAVTGMTPCTGQVELGGTRIDGLRAHRRARAGIGRVFQGGELCDDLIVAENILLGPVVTARSREARLGEVLELLDITGLRDRHVGDLSRGQQRLVAIARGLVQQPDLLLLDEPAAGLDSNESAWLGSHLLAVRDAGTAILLVEHDLPLVLAVCDELTVLDLGRVIASGAPEQVAADPAVRAAYMGDLPTVIEAVS